MAVEAAAVAVGKATLILIQSLRELRSLQKLNSTIVQEIDQFITSLSDNIDNLKEKLPSKSGSSALESLQKDLDKTREELDKNLKNGNFKKFWDAKEIKGKLERLRQNLVNKIQLTQLITTLEVAINADEKMDNFQSRMMELFAMSTAHDHAATAEIRKLLQPLVVGMRRQDQKLESFFSQVRGNEVKVETSSETQKFLADILANLEDLTDEETLARRTIREDERDDYLDPFTMDLMNDPVKCTDGHTYDRFSVLKYNLHQRVALEIACDDLTVRGKLFEKFADEGLESKCRNLRASYRDEALAFASKGYSAEALRMLKHVLQWAANDRECLEMKDKLEQEIAKQPPVLAEQIDLRSAPSVGYLVSPQPTRVGNDGEYRPENRTPQRYSDQQNLETLKNRVWSAVLSEERSLGSSVCSIIFLAMCFPCSLCCIPCLFPDVFKQK